jgi:hypothetical protein
MRFLFLTVEEISWTVLMAGGGATGNGKPTKTKTKKIGNSRKKSGRRQLSLFFNI